MRQLGHSSISVTVDSHRHLLPGLLEQVDEKLDTMLDEHAAGGRKRGGVR